MNQFLRNKSAQSYLAKSAQFYLTVTLGRLFHLNKRKALHKIEFTSTGCLGKMSTAMNNRRQLFNMFYNKNIDIMKGIAIIFVILVHSFSDRTVHKIGGPFYLFQAVPVFFILSAYNQSQSYERRQLTQLNGFYRPTLLAKKYYRLIPIAIVIYLIQALVNPENQTFFFYLIGRGGYGGYYISMMIQAILVLPLLYWFAKKTSAYKMLGVSFGINLLFEFYSYFIDIPAFLYRLLVIRYLFALALGVWYFFESSHPCAKKVLTVGAVFSLIYLALVHYLEIPVPLYSYDTSWKGQNPFSFFYALAIFHLGMTYLPSFKGDSLKNGLSFLGKRSYSIFLVQMLYFWVIAFYTEWPERFFLLDVVVCCILGSLLFKLEKRFVSGKIKAFLK